MTSTCLQNALKNALEAFVDARDQMEDGERDCTDLADILIDLVEENEDIETVDTFDDAGLLTSNDGLVVRTVGGAEFQITIVQSRRGRDD